MSSVPTRRCSACGSAHVTLVPRGYAGNADTPDQYIVCQQCQTITYEIVAVSQRDIRLQRYEVNGVLHRDGRTYHIRRILKVGFDEFLLYLRLEPTEPEADAAADDDEAAAPAPSAQPVRLRESSAG